MHSYLVIPPSARRLGGSSSCRRGTPKMASSATCRRPFRGRRCMRCWCQRRTSSSLRPCPRFPSGWRRWRRLLANRSSPGWPKITPRSASGPVRCPHSPGPQFVVPWYATRTVKANPGFSCLQTIGLSATSWGGPVKCCRSSNNRCAPCQFWWWPPCWTWGCCSCMTGSYRGLIRWQRDKGPWPFWWGPNSLRGFRGTPRRDASRGTAIYAGGRRQRGCRRPSLVRSLRPGQVVEARLGGQRMLIMSAWGPGPARVDVIGEVVQDYGWKLLASAKRSLRVVRWPRLLEHLSGMSDGQPLLDLVSTWDQARPCLLRSATARAIARALPHHQEASSAVWQDLWSQCCECGCVPSRSVLRLECCGCGETALVWVHQCAFVPHCGPCRERAGRGWPKARWALRHSVQVSSSASKAIQHHLRGVRVDGVWGPSEPTAAMPLLLWWAALDGNSRVLWPWHHRGPCGEAASVGGDAA